MNILEIVQESLSATGFVKPTSIIANSDRTASLAFSLLKLEVKALSRKTQFQALQREVLITTIAAENQGAIDTIIPNMDFILNDTMWNRSLNRPVFGPLSPQQTQQNKAFFQSGPWNQYFIREGNLYFYPIPAAGQQVYVQYISKAVGKTVGGVEINYFTEDTDIPFMDEEALILGVRWRFLAKNEVDYTQEKADYDECINNLIARDATKQVLSMDDVKYDIMPGIFVPSGSWTL